VEKGSLIEAVLDIRVCSAADFNGNMQLLKFMDKSGMA